MKIAIIILTVLTVIFGCSYKLLKAYISNNPEEVLKLHYGYPSIIAGICGLCRLLAYLCAVADVTLLLIKFL